MNSKSSDKNLEKDKLAIIKWVTGLKDDTAIERIKLLKNKKRKDWWVEIEASERLAINEGLNDLKEGKVKQHKEVKKIYEKWL